jgi:hypothetical protein
MIITIAVGVVLGLLVFTHLRTVFTTLAVLAVLFGIFLAANWPRDAEPQILPQPLRSHSMNENRVAVPTPCVRTPLSVADLDRLCSKPAATLVPSERDTPAVRRIAPTAAPDALPGVTAPPPVIKHTIGRTSSIACLDLKMLADVSRDSYPSGCVEFAPGTEVVVIKKSTDALGMKGGVRYNVACIKWSPSVASDSCYWLIAGDLD